MGSAIVRPASGYTLSSNPSYTLTADTSTALSDSSDATAIRWDNTPDNPLASSTVHGSFVASSALSAVVATAINVQAFVHIRAATVAGADRAAGVEFNIAGRLFFTDWLQVGDSGGHDFDISAGPDTTVREYVSGIVRGSSTDGNPMTLAEAESFASSMEAGASFGLTLLVGVSSDPGLVLTEMWLEVTWDGSEWPLRVVSAAGDVYRIGPDYNPDGGLLRLVEADGTVWRQGAGGPVTEALYATSHSFGSSGAGADDISGWSADAPDAITADDGVDLRWNTGNINNDGVFGDVWADAIFPADLSVPSGATFTTKQPQMAMTGTVSGTFVREVYDPTGTLLSTNTTGFFDASALTADMIRAGGWFIRIYSERASGSPYTIRANFQIDSAWIDLAYDGPARPLRYVSSDGTVEVTLPMVLDT